MNIEAILMSEKKVREIIVQSGGICLSCGAVEHNSIEPDTINHKCKECRERRVVGIETAISSGWVINSERNQPNLHISWLFNY